MNIPEVNEDLLSSVTQGLAPDGVAEVSRILHEHTQKQDRGVFRDCENPTVSDIIARGAAENSPFPEERRLLGIELAIVGYYNQLRTKVGVGV